MQKDKIKKAVPLALGSTMMIMTMLPAASAFAATGNPYITGLNVKASGDNVTAMAMTSGHFVVNYEFKAENAQGQWKIVRSYQPNAKFTAPSWATHVQGFAMTQYELAHKQWNMKRPSNVVAVKAAPTNPITSVTEGVVGNKAVAAASTTGNQVVMYEFKVENSSGQWQIVRSYQSSPSFTFTGTKAGTYKIKAFALTQYELDHQMWGRKVASSAHTITVKAGAPAAIKLSPKSNSLLADGTAADTITATVVDKYGNPVTDYSGTATIAGSGLIADANSAGVQASDVSSHTLTFTKGVATFVVGPTRGTQTATISATTSGLSTGTLTLPVVTPTVTNLGLKVASGSPPDLSANSSSSSTTLDLTTRDGQNNPIYGSGHYVTLKLSGPGSFEPTSGGATPVTSETQFVHSSSGTYPVTVYGIEGQPGTVTVTASSSGLTGASVDVPSYVIGAPAALSVSSTVESGSSGAYTQYTVDVLDANGHVIPGNSNTIAATVKSAASGVVAMSSSSSFATSHSATVTATASNGVATFDVKTKTVGTGPATLAITDSSQPSIPTVDTTYSYTAEAPNQLLVTPAGTYNIKAGQAVTVYAQVADVNGNPVSESGQSVDFTASLPSGVTFANGSSASYSATTNASGVASATITASSNTVGSTRAVTVSATDTTTSLATGSATGLYFESATNTDNYATQIGLTSSTYSGTAISSVTVTANSSSFSKTITAFAENAVGGKVANNDMFQITSSNSKVVAVTTGSVTSNAGSYSVGGDLTVGEAGTATVTVKDLSDQAQPSKSFTVTVKPGSAVGPVIEYNGAPVSSSNPVSLSANSPVQLQVVNADNNGDPIPVTGSQPLTVDLGTSGISGAFESVAGGGPITTTTIGAGQSSATVYFESATSETVSSTSDLTASPSVSRPTSFTATETAGAIGTTWSSVSGATGYDVYRSTSSNGTYSKVTSTTGTSYSDASVTSGAAGKTYYYEVKAIGAGGYLSAASTAASATYGAAATSTSATSFTSSSSTGYSATITVSYNNTLSSSAVSSSDFAVTDTTASHTLTVTSATLSSGGHTVTLTVSGSSTAPASGDTYTVSSTSSLQDHATNPVSTSVSGTL